MSAKAPSGDEQASARDGAPSGVVSRTRRAGRPELADRVTYRWTAIATVMAALLVVYTLHPYYRGGQFAVWRPVFIGAFAVWLVFGRLYVRRTLERFTELRYVVRDGGLHLLILGKAFREKRLRRVLRNPRVRTTVLGIAVKAFFTPLMTSFLAGHINAIGSAWMRHKGLPPIQVDVPKGLGVLAQAGAWWAQVKMRLPDLVPHAQDFAGLLTPASWTLADWRWGLGFAYDVVFFIDCSFALIGYASESRWLGNKTRSVEPTVFGWFVCLACYPPWNHVLGVYLPLENSPTTHFGEVGLVVLKGISVALFTIYASATVAFGFKFSNLTHRGVVSRGPYRVVRHPAYLTKCLAWWCEHIPTLTPAKAFFLTGLCGVYALRAWTEERHLGKDPAYQAYRAKVRWVLVPGVF